MIRRSTIEKAVAGVVQLEVAYLDVETQSEAQYGFFTQSARRAQDLLRQRADKAREKIVKRLVDEGVIACEDGVTSEEADHPLLEGIDGLFEIGDGSWC